METIRTTVTHFTDGINVEGLHVKLSNATRLNILACKADVINKQYMTSAEVNVLKQSWDKTNETTSVVAVDERGKPDESLRFKTFTMYVDKTGTVQVEAWLHNNHEEKVFAEFKL